MACANNGNYPIQSKSPLLSVKQSYRPALIPGSSLRMSDQNEYSKPSKEASKLINSLSTKILQKKPHQDPFSTLQMQGILDGKDLGDQYNTCMKHPKKKAKYFIKENNFSQKDEYFCSKCALDHAMKGLKVEKFLNKEEKYRKGIIDEFLGKISESKAFCNQVKVGLLKQKSENTAIHSFRLESLKDFFIGLENLIAEEKTSILSEIQTNTTQTQTKLEADFEKIGNINSEIERFQDDINQNYSKIINKMDLEPFIEIMQKYDDKLLTLTKAAAKPACSEEISLEITDFRRPSKDFFENLRNLIRVFVGLNSKLKRVSEEDNENRIQIARLQTICNGATQLNKSQNDEKKCEIAIQNKNEEKKCDIVLKSNLNETANSKRNDNTTIAALNQQRKTSLSNKENQERNIIDVTAHTQRNPVTNEHIYSNILNHMTVVRKGNGSVKDKGFFSGIGKNYKAFNSTEVKTGKNQPLETRIATIHVPLGNGNGNR